MIRIGLRCPIPTTTPAERVSVCVLAGLTLVSLMAAVEHYSLRIHIGRAAGVPARTITTQHPESRIVAEAPPPETLAPEIQNEAAQPVTMNTRSIRAASQVPRAPTLPGQTTGDATKMPELPKMTRILSPARDMDYGEADRSVLAPSVRVIGRRKNIPMLRGDRAFTTWGGEFAAGDSRLKDMIQAGALTSVARGAKVRVLEVRGELTRVEVNGQGRTGWIRSASLGK